MNKKLLSLLLFTLLVVAARWWLNRPQPVTVRAVAVEHGTVEATVTNTRAGTIKACRRSKLSMPIGGVVDQLLVKEGDSVADGQRLLELWNHDRKAELDRAVASHQAAIAERRRACIQVEFAAREAQRQRTLLQQKLTSEEAADSAETRAITSRHSCEAAAAQVEVALAHANLQRALLDRSRLHAPFAGVVAEINGEVGEYITPSPPGVATPPAVDLIDYSCLYVTAPIDEVDAGQLSVGLPVRVTLDAFRDRQFEGQLTRIAPYVLDLEKQARTVAVDVQIAPSEAELALLVGYSADITVVLASNDNSLRVPTEALVTEADGQWLWLVQQGRLQRREVQTGLSNWHYSEIRQGLQAGDRIVMNPDKPGLQSGIEVVIGDD